MHLLKYDTIESGGSTGGAILPLLFLFNYNMALRCYFPPLICGLYKRRSKVCETNIKF